MCACKVQILQDLETVCVQFSLTINFSCLCPYLLKAMWCTAITDIYGDLDIVFLLLSLLMCQFSDFWGTASLFLIIKKHIIYMEKGSFPEE